MHNKTMYWIAGIIAAVIAVMAIWFTLGHYAQYQENGKNNHSEHGQTAPESTLDGNMPAVPETSQYLKEQDIIMSDMMRNMEIVSDSGNASIDFLKGMIPHHDSAIAMADSYMKNGAKDPALIEIATQIKGAQTQEIQQMNQMIQRLQTSGAKNEAKAKAYWQGYKNMLAKHHEMHGASPDNIDEAFAEGMIMHHQMAVDMAKEILKYTDDTEIRTLAETIISSQEQEIRQMQEIKNTLEASKANPL